ncbi:MAG: BrnT family toxin [Bryobacteraceae bacterium]|jgi:uncharacterized DUF497 family protein
MVVTFEWDLSKAATNIRKHGIAFEEAATIFRDALATTFPDPDHSVIERREITIGYTIKRRLAFVSHCERDRRIRIISARVATPAERRQYEEGIES